MKILFLNHAGAPGGASLSLSLLVRKLTQTGHECCVLQARESSAVSSLLKNAGAKVDRVDISLVDHSAVAPRALLSPKTIAMWIRAACSARADADFVMRYFSKTGADVIHLNSAPFVFLARELARRGAPFVWHVREPPPSNGFRTAFISRVLRGAPVTVFICKADREAWSAPEGHVVRNPVSPELLGADMNADQARALLGIPRNAYVILYLGGPAKAKGARVLLEAFRKCANQSNSLYLLACGFPSRDDRSWRAKLGSWLPSQLRSVLSIHEAFTVLAAELGRSRMAVMPFIADQRLLFSVADTVVFPALRSHFPRPLMEAVALGIPVVGSDLPAVKEIVAMTKLGKLVPPGDSNQLAAAFLEDSGRMRNVDRKAAGAGEFSSDYHAARMEALFEKAVRK